MKSISVDKKCAVPSTCATSPEVIRSILEKCKGCSKCARNCPVGAITGKIKSPYVIDSGKMYQMWSMFRELVPLVRVYTE